MAEPKKTPMTDEERLALAQKMDQDLDDFINSMERRKYNDGWSEDKWEEEMDKHPFFMKTTPEAGQMSPLVEGLAKLKFDPEENTPQELAASYKEDGNFNFKHKNYRLAILGYTEGLRVKCDDDELNASLYNNRAAAHLRLKNYRSCLFDSEKALALKPDHGKARIHAAKAAYEINKYEICIEHCNKLLEDNPNDLEASPLLKSAKMKNLILKRDQRKKEKMQCKDSDQRKLLVKAVMERGIRISGAHDEDEIDIALLGPRTSKLCDTHVSIDNGLLKWPVLFLYPEYNMSDLIKGCPENVPLTSQLQQVFPAPWDKKHKYSWNKVTLYFEGHDRQPHSINVNQKLGDILKSYYYEMKAGTPAFLIVPTGSIIERCFLESYND